MLIALDFHLGCAGPGSSVGCASDWYSGGRRFDPPVRQHSSMGSGHKIISTAILSLLMIQVGQLSVTGERIGLSLPWKIVDRLITDRLDVTIVVDWDVKQHSNKQTNHLGDNINI